MKEPGVSPEEALRAVERVHAPEYVAEIRALSQRGGGFIDHDTCACVRLSVSLLYIFHPNPTPILTNKP